MVPLSGSLVPVPYNAEPGTSDWYWFREPVGTGNQSKPKVLISSRDEAPVPPLAGVKKLAELATAGGWRTKTTYALALIPDEYYLNGNLAKPAHRLESIAVRLRRNQDGGWAMWHREDEGRWHFAHAFVGITRYGWSPRGKLPSILERIKAQ